MLTSFRAAAKPLRIKVEMPIKRGSGHKSVTAEWGVILYTMAFIVC